MLTSDHEGLTVIADLAAIDPSVKQNGSSIWQNTFTQAQKYNLQMQKVVEAKFLPCSYYGSASSSVPRDSKMPQARTTNGFLNDYYDDEGWWALAWWVLSQAATTLDIALTLSGLPYTT